jgi:hypothetical protein
MSDGTEGKCLMGQKENAYKTLKTNLNERDHL